MRIADRCCGAATAYLQRFSAPGGVFLPPPSSRRNRSAGGGHKRRCWQPKPMSNDGIDQELKGVFILKKA
ncbi:MAG: hypothetical protein ACLQT6_16380 [Desulfomonilaceae bacterium]